MQFNPTVQSNNINVTSIQNVQELLEESDFDDSDKDPDYTPSANDVSMISDQSAINDDINLTLGIEAESHDAGMSVPDVRETVKSRKQKRNSGVQYITKTGRTVEQRMLKKLEDCRKKCKNLISHEDQKAIFEGYWNLGSHSTRLQYLSGLIDVIPKKSEKLVKVAKTVRNRTHTNIYYFNIRDSRVNVCQKCFLNTICETEQIIKTVIKKKIYSASGCVEVDRRGRHTPGYKLPENLIQAIRDHINSFPAYESHYTR